MYEGQGRDLSTVTPEVLDTSGPCLLGQAEIFMFGANSRCGYEGRTTKLALAASGPCQTSRCDDLKDLLYVSPSAHPSYKLP
jgi:hypothetical protein